MAESDAAEIERLMRDYTALWNGDFSKLDAVAGSVTVHHPSAPDGVVHGREALEAFVREFHSGYPDFHVTVHDWLAPGEVVMKEDTTTGTHEGAVRGVPPTGREVEHRETARVRVADGRVREVRLHFDRLAVLERRGLAAEWGRPSPPVSSRPAAPATLDAVEAGGVGPSVVVLDAARARHVERGGGPAPSAPRAGAATWDAASRPSGPDRRAPAQSAATPSVAPSPAGTGSAWR